MLKQLLTQFILFAALGLNLEAKEYQVAFYSDFEPISYSQDRDSLSSEFDSPEGYEIDLIRAIEALSGSEMTFAFHGVKEWDGIWLKPYTDSSIDIALGGITRETRRLLNDEGEQVVAATHKTVDFKQSLLMSAENAALIKTHDDLACDFVVGAVRGTTGEYRYLAQALIIDNLDNGFIKKGFVVVLEDGSEITSDGILSIYDPALESRTYLLPPNTLSPITRYYIAEDTMIPSLEANEIQAIARGYIGNQLVAERSLGALAVTAIYSLECPRQRSVKCDKKEEGVFFVKAEDLPLLTKLNRYIDILTDGGKIGYIDWKANKNIFLERALKSKQA